MHISACASMGNNHVHISAHQWEAIIVVIIVFIMLLNGVSDQIVKACGSLSCLCDGWEVRLVIAPVSRLPDDH